jgi:hypothetical protein
MGEAARKLVGEEFDNSVYLDRLGEVLRNLANSSPLTGASKGPLPGSRSTQ